MENQQQQTKTYRDISTLKPFKDNPREITPEGFDRLKKQITKLGQYCPLLILEDGTVISGNMRYRAYLDLGIDLIWVEVIPKEKEGLAVEYAISANDLAGKYDKEALLKLIENNPNLELDSYAVSFEEPEILTDFMDQFNEEKPHKCTCPTCGRKHNSKVNAVRVND